MASNRQAVMPREALIRQSLSLICSRLPTLGDESKKFQAVLCEPEINAFYAAQGFMESCCRTMIAEFPELAGDYQRYLDHYNPTLKALAERLSRDFDGK